ncbi:MAG: LPS export ABC transporter periplasmic protein LptC [Flavobacteriales bacterium CG_4_9_14_3_um_filter_40_17]|nr:MAG: LPS export ABC transporter periplasmic protein LptC [Flavobacteriales bacterium CG_4_9_14_3_um_filter_40_17]
MLKGNFKALTFHIAATLVVAMFFSCQDNLGKIQKMQLTSRAPIGIAENFSLKYTDSGRVTSHLISAKMIDYSNRKFSFSRFPEGLLLYFFDKNNFKTTVKADKAVNYDSMDVIELLGNVKIIKHDGALLETDQLFWDQKNEWLFSEKKFKFTDVDGSVVEGFGIDFNLDLTIINITRFSAESLINENQ